MKVRQWGEGEGGRGKEGRQGGSHQHCSGVVRPVYCGNGHFTWNAEPNADFKEKEDNVVYTFMYTVEDLLHRIC